MREFAKVSPQIWTNESGRKIKQLGIEARVVSLYLNTNPYANMTGVYYMPVVLIAHEVGLSIDDATSALNKLCEIGYCSYDHDFEYVWVHDMAVDQVAAQLKSNDNRVKAINSIFSALPKLSFLQDFYEKYSNAFFINDAHGLEKDAEASSNTLASKEKENEKYKKKEKEIFSSGKPDITHDEKSILKQQSIEILQFLNEKTGHGYRAEDCNLNLIMARLKSGATADDCRAVIVRKYREWSDSEEMKKYLRPATLFNATKFEQYLGECVVQQDEVMDEAAEGYESEEQESLS